MSKKDELSENAQAFLTELDTLCEKYNITVAHEDQQGAFILIPYNGGNGIDYGCYEAES